MDTRFLDWTPLGLEEDPAPGSCGMLRGIERDFRRMGDDAREVTAGLDAVLRDAEDGGFRGLPRRRCGRRYRDA